MARELVLVALGSAVLIVVDGGVVSGSVIVTESFRLDEMFPAASFAQA
jgi:hypothetical protein